MSVTQRLLNSRIRIDGDLAPNSGQLGVHGNITGSISPFNVVPSGSVTRYFSSYFVNAGTAPSVALQLPPIGTGVSIGWKARFYYVFTSTSLVGGAGSQVLDISNSSGTIIYTLNSSVFRGTAFGSLNTLIPFTVTAIGPGINNWLFEVEAPSYAQPGYFTTYSSSNNDLQASPFGQLGKITTRSDGTSNINVLFSSPVIISFSTLPTLVTNDIYFRDGNFYSITSTRVTFNRTGSYFIEFLIALTLAGGATNTNCQFAARLNGTTTLPAHCINTTNTITSNNLFLYSFKCYFSASATNFIELLGGRSATTGGTVTLNSNTIYTIYCLGT